MTEAGKNARNEYHKAYREKNKERIKKHNADYWERKSKQQKEQQQEAEEN